MMVHAMFALAEHLHASAYSIGFPEMSISIVLALRAAAKKSKIGAFQVRVSPNPDPDPNPNPNPNSCDSRVRWSPCALHFCCRCGSSLQSSAYLG